MKNKALLSFIVLLLLPLFIACGNKSSNVDSDGVYIIKADFEKQEDVSFFDIFSHVELIPLETNDSVLIMTPDKVFLHDDKYFVFDYRKAEILSFNSSGRFLNKITALGQGPQEYLHVSDFKIDPFSNRILVLDPISSAMFEYDLECNFISKYKLPKTERAYLSFIILNEDILAFHTFDYTNRIKFYSRKDDAFIKETFPEKENILNWNDREFSYKNYYGRTSSNTIYELTDKCEIVDAYKWDFGSLNNSKEQISKIADLTKEEQRNMSGKVSTSEIINYILYDNAETPRGYYTSVLRNKKRIFIFHDKKENKNYVFNKTKEGADFHPATWHDGYVLAFYYQELADRYDVIPNSILDEKSIEIKEKMKDDDNPVILKYYLKK